MKVEVLVTYATSAITPYWVKAHPMPFEELCKVALELDARAMEKFLKDYGKLYNITKTRPGVEVMLVEESTFVPTCETSVYRAGADGRAVLWMERRDSSG